MQYEAQKILNGYEAGFVQRYHTHPRLAMFGQTDGHHSFGVAAIVIGLHPDPSGDLLKACITHDMGERFCGDIPAPVKRDNPELSVAFGDLEREKLDTHFVNASVNLSDDDMAWLKMADMMECYLFASLTVPSALVTKPWVELMEAIEQRAYKIGVLDGVRDVLYLARKNQGFREAETDRVYK